jgi:hypothetical protein
MAKVMSIKEFIINRYWEKCVDKTEYNKWNKLLNIKDYYLDLAITDYHYDIYQKYIKN